MCVDHGWSVRCMTSKATLEYPQFNNYYLAHKTQQVIPKPQIRIFTNFLIDLTISVYLFVIAFLSNTICLEKIGSWISWAIYDWYEKKYQFHLSGKCVLHTPFLRENVPLNKQTNTKNSAEKDSCYKNLALSSEQSQCMKVGSKLYYCCKEVAVTTYLYYILSELKNIARPAQTKTNHQTFDT